MPAPQTTTPTFESVWAALQETAQIVKEVGRKQEEYAENLKETERVLKEDSQRLKEEFDNRLGALTNLFGDVTEAMVAPKICEKFKEIGLFFPKASRDIEFNDTVNDISFEVDIMLENSDKAMLIEVKTKLTDERIDKHILRLEK